MPEYRFECIIRDGDNEIVGGSTFVGEIDSDGNCESVDMEVGRVLRAFNTKFRDEYEAENYSIDQEDA